MTEALAIFLTIFSSIHIGYLLILLLAIKKSKEIKGQNSVSVIIAARNEEQNLPELLKALQRQTHPNYEVIIVDDRSNDGTSEILGQHTDSQRIKTISIKKTPRNWNGKKYAIFQAIQAAQKEVLLFTDADCLPSSDNWISEMTDAISDKTEVVLGYSPYVKKRTFLNRLIQFETFLTAIQYLGFAHLGLPYMAVGRNWAVKKEIYPISYLKSISHLTGGDDDLIAQQICHRTNTKIVFEQDSQTSSEAENNWKGLINQKKRHLRVGHLYSKKIKTLLGIFTFSYGMSWLLFIALIINQQWSTALLIYGIRSLSFYIIFIRLGRKLDTKSPVWALPILDFCYPLWYAFLGIRSLAAKQIEWKPESSFLIKH